MAVQEEVAEEGMVPFGTENLLDGVYPVEMKSGSVLFKADHCELTVRDGQMEVTLYMSSDSYLAMFAGTAEEVAADGAETIPLEDGAFTLPVKALDEALSFAAYSRKNERWYDRTLLFLSDSLPADAFREGFLPTVESLGLADGEYTVEVRLRGGTGKASVSSPARLMVENGAAVAEIVWSSSKYDYVRIGEEMYLPVNTEGNSTFLLPVGCFDHSLAIVADTTAMSQPHEIAYTLYFVSGSVRPVS